MSSKPLLSIVTVTFNDLPGLDRTLRSLTALAVVAGADLEVVVIDGGTGPDAQVTITELMAASLVGPTRLVSEPDRGIYDAMNKGLRLTAGAHVWFLNGGDVSCVDSWPGLKAQLQRHPHELLLADYLLHTGRTPILRHSRDGSYIWHGLPTSHQAIFYPGEQTRHARYDLAYRIVGDYELTARLIAAGMTTQNWHKPVAVFSAGGVSQANTRLLAREAGRVQREILRLPPVRRLLSQGRHLVSRNLRAFQTRHATPALAEPVGIGYPSAGRAAAGLVNPTPRATE